MSSDRNSFYEISRNVLRDIVTIDCEYFAYNIDLFIKYPIDISYV